MNVVIVKHENSGAKYAFLVPEDKTLKAGDLVKVNTMHKIIYKFIGNLSYLKKRGETLVTCLCDSFTVDVTDKEKMKSIFNAFGVDEPTAYVIGKFTYDEWE